MHTRELIRFLDELSTHNNRPWFLHNKPRYDILREEFLLLVIKVIEGVGKFDPAVADASAKKALFRIHKDMRFSKEKIPYKTHFSAAFSASGLKKPSQGGGPAYYFHIDQNGTLLYGAGEYLPPPPRLKAIREQIMADPKGFGKVLSDKALCTTYGQLNQEDKLSRPPKGFDGESVHADYLKLKSFGIWNEVDAMKASEPDLAKTLIQGFKDSQALIKWLRAIPLA
ncbi:DUF2461 domain-containing protein [Ampullimonas aquatilis]|uniref:DUF2461 domain-containing protein n=1 Tax=Ampullimonas aquatilis TaxID=1341549 RepID=UPI003C72490A